MPLPLLFMGVAAMTTTLGAMKTVKAGIDTVNTKGINKEANEIVESSTNLLNAQRKACGDSISRLGAEKLFVLNSSMSQFLDTFTKLKNVNFKETEGLDELHRLHVDQKEFAEMKTMVNFAGSLASGAIAGTAGGTLATCGAFSAAQALASASTGTAISALHGAAATNATLAFFGGGPVAIGGLGVHGGIMVLGGLVAGPAFMITGFVTGHVAKKNLDKALTNKAEALQIAAQLDAASIQCETIRRRTYVFYNLLARLDAYFLPLIYKMEDVIKAEGCDYKAFSDEAKRTLASCTSTAVSVKSVLDTPILTDDGLLTDESENAAAKIEGFLKNMRIP